MEQVLPFKDIKLLAFNKNNNKLIISNNSYVKLLILDTSSMKDVYSGRDDVLKIMFDCNDNILVLTKKNLTIYRNNSSNIIKSILSRNNSRNSSKSDFVGATINNSSINGEKLILIHADSSIDVYPTDNYILLNKLDTSLYTSLTNIEDVHAIPSSKINIISLNNDNTKVVYEDFRGLSIKILNIITNKIIKNIETNINMSNSENRKNKYCIFSLDNEFILEIYKNQIKYFNIRSGLLEKTVIFLTDFIVLSPTQDVVVGYDSSKIKIFNIHGKEISFSIDNAYSVYKIVYSLDGNKIALISNQNISIFNVRTGIMDHNKLWNMVTRENRLPLTKELIDESLLSENKKNTLQKFIAKLLSNYSYFKIYLENNDLIGKFNTTHFMNIILNSNLRLYQNDFSIFINNIIKFINSTPYSVLLMQDHNASILIKYYINIMREYLLYLYYHYQKIAIRITSRSFRIDNVMHDEELNILIANMTEPSLYLRNLLSIRYYGEQGINAGGLTKTFLTAVETQLNSGLLKRLILNPEERLNYKINILAISKINNNPITIINDEVLKKKIILLITSYFRSDIKKNIVYKLLLNEEINDPSPSFLMSYGTNDTGRYELSGNIEYSGNPENEKLFSNSLSSIYKLNINRLNIDSSFTPVNFKNNGRSNHVNSKNNSKNNTNLDSMSFKIYIDELIESGIYKNYLDFYLSHFLEVKVNKVLLINRLTFENRSGMSVANFDRFKMNFIKLIETLNDKDIVSFNNAISGSNLLQQNYIILVLNQDSRNIELWPKYHTCFNRMDIESYISFSKHYLDLDLNGKIKESSKTKFMKSVNFVVKNGYGMG